MDGFYWKTPLKWDDLGGKPTIFRKMQLRKITDFDYLGIGQLLVGGGNSNIWIIFTPIAWENGPI